MKFKVEYLVYGTNTKKSGVVPNNPPVLEAPSLAVLLTGLAKAFPGPDNEVTVIGIKVAPIKEEVITEYTMGELRALTSGS